MTKLSKETQEAVAQVVIDRGFRHLVETQGLPVRVKMNRLNEKADPHWDAHWTGYHWAVFVASLSDSQNATMRRAADETAGRVTLAEAFGVPESSEWHGTFKRFTLASPKDPIRYACNGDVVSFDKDGPKAEPTGKPHGAGEVTTATTFATTAAVLRRFVYACDPDGTEYSFERKIPDFWPCYVARAMEAMSNVAACCWNAAKTCKENLELYAHGQRAEHNCKSDGAYPGRRARASEEWSRQVRAKVAALPQPGPRVFCQQDDE